MRYAPLRAIVLNIFTKYPYRMRPKENKSSYLHMDTHTPPGALSSLIKFVLEPFHHHSVLLQWQLEEPKKEESNPTPTHEEI
jgi:hypothetical protein